MLWKERKKKVNHMLQCIIIVLEKGVRKQLVQAFNLPVFTIKEHSFHLVYSVVA